MNRLPPMPELPGDVVARTRTGRYCVVREKHGYVVKGRRAPYPKEEVKSGRRFSGIRTVWYWVGGPFARVIDALDAMKDLEK